MCPIGTSTVPSDVRFHRPVLRTSLPYRWTSRSTCSAGIVTVSSSIHVPLFLADDRHTPARAERPRRHFEDRRRLLALELRHADQLQDSADGRLIVALRDDFFGALA